MGVRIARKHVSWYLSARPDAKVLRYEYNRLPLAADQLHFIEKLSNQLIDQPSNHKELAA